MRERLNEEINAFHVAATGLADGRLLGNTAREKGGELCAGLFGWTWGGCGYIEVLWVRTDQRGRGLSDRLLAAAEQEIRRRGCDQVALSTHFFQAPGFYARFGLPGVQSHTGLPARARPDPLGQAVQLTGWLWRVGGTEQFGWP